MPDGGDPTCHVPCEVASVDRLLQASSLPTRVLAVLPRKQEVLFYFLPLAELGLVSDGRRQHVSPMYLARISTAA